MGFPAVSTPAGLAALESFLEHDSYIDGHSASQADVAVYKEVGAAPDATKFPHVSRWYSHVKALADSHASLPGDASKGASAYGPEVAAAPAAAAAEEDDDDLDLFGSDDEEVDAEAEALKQKRLDEYKAKKATKPKEAAKSVVTLDVKPWDDTTDMKALEAAVRSIQKDGLVWGGSKLVAVGYGVFKLQINLVVEDEKISLSDLEEEICEFEDFVQSADVQAMQKL